jgi:hypothetical protein
MKLRIDPHSLRVRLTYDETVRLRSGEALSETFALIGLDLEVRASAGSELGFREISPGNTRVDVPTEALSGVLERIGQPGRKKEDFGIRGVFETPRGRSELVLEIDYFDTKRDKSLRPGKDV